MNVSRISTIKLASWVVVAVIGIVWLWPLRQSLRFGLDLVGGTHLTLEVHTQEAIDAKLVSYMRTIESALKRTQKATPIAKNVKDGVMSMTFSTMQQVQDALAIVRDNQFEVDHKTEGTTFYLTFAPSMAERIKKEAVASNIEVLRTRLDRFSVAEIPIAAQGDKYIVVELPDVANAQQAKERIGKAAKLEFRLVDKVSSSKEDLLYEYDGALPEDKEILMGTETQALYYVVNKYADVTGNMLKDASHGNDQSGLSGLRPVVFFTFNPDGAERFYDLTSKNYGRTLAIVLDNEVISAATIEAAIRESGMISSDRFTKQKARELATLLKSGSFAASVTFEDERQIGPGLGNQARKDGLISCLVGLGLLFIFSIAYYSLSGFFAFLALLYNMVLVLVGLRLLNATLTLPGIAGMVLTVGMAIDASILIYERIKEELSRGNAIKKAVTLGFSDAMVVILDANITTFIVGAVLYYFGTGPIQGFAVTMMLGVVATLISGLFFLRSLFMFVLDTFAIQKLRI